MIILGFPFPRSSVSSARRFCVANALHADTLRSFEDIIDGRADDLPEQAFLYVGFIDELREKAKAL